MNRSRPKSCRDTCQSPSVTSASTHRTYILRLLELFLDDYLRGNARVIEARYPRHILLHIAHFVPADQRVLRTGMNSLPRTEVRTAYLHGHSQCVANVQ